MESLLTGFTLRNGEPCVTDDNGMVFGIGPKNTALTVQSPYLDCKDISHQITSDNIITPVDLTFTRADTQNITINRSKDCKFSKMCWSLICVQSELGLAAGRMSDITGQAAALVDQFPTGTMFCIAEKLYLYLLALPNGSAAAGDTVISGLGKDLVGEGATAADRYSGSPSQSRNGGNGQVQWYFLDEDGMEPMENQEQNILLAIQAFCVLAAVL